MVDDTRTSWGTRIVVVLVALLLLWLLTGLAIGVAKAAISLIGYIIVGVVAYQLGKFAGRHAHGDEG